MYCPCRDGNNFVFQYLRGHYAGKPLREAADSTLNEAFTVAVRRAESRGQLLPQSMFGLRTHFGMRTVCIC